MPHFSGQANSYAELRTALINACTQHGWTTASSVDGEVLVKADVALGDLVVELVVITTEDADSSNGEGLRIQGATGWDGSALVAPSPATPRLGPPHETVSPAVWPMEYDIHLQTSPVDEVYLVVKFGVDKHLWLAFGRSSVSLPGTGGWVAAISPRRASTFSGGGVTISFLGTKSFEQSTTSGPFWLRRYQVDQGLEYSLHAGVTQIPGWTQATNLSNGPGNGGSALGSQPLVERSPSAWNQEAILLPLQAYMEVEENKSLMLADMQHARLVRVDNFEPGQLITLGADQWRVYPWYRKNLQERDGGTRVDHSGTLGWAIRFDGVV